MRSDPMGRLMMPIDRLLEWLSDRSIARGDPHDDDGEEVCGLPLEGSKSIRSQLVANWTAAVASRHSCNSATWTVFLSSAT